MRHLRLFFILLAILAFPTMGEALQGGVSVGALEVLCTADATLTVQEISRAILNSYGRSAAVTDTLPVAASGMSFTAVVGTQHNSAWKILRGGTDTLTVDGTASKTYIQETNQAVGSYISCVSFKTGASAWTWICTTGSGTWATD